MKTIPIIAILILSAFTLKAQDTLAGWTFPTGTNADANPDHGIPANAAMTISVHGGTSAADFSKNGLTTYSAHATGWNNGANLKYWQIEVNTTGYGSLKLSSIQTSGGSYPAQEIIKRNTELIQPVPGLTFQIQP